MNPVSVDFVDMLEAFGDSSGFSLNLKYADSLFIGNEPAKPVNCVTLFDTSGFGPDLALETQGYDRPAIQIRIRNTRYTTAMGLAEEIKDALHGRSHETWNGTLYTVIQCVGSPALLDFDDNGNCRIVLNVNAQRRSV